MMNCIPDISVVMPVFNGARLLRRMVDSILAQTHINFELICVDDGSTDSSMSILCEYRSRDPRIIVIKQTNMGGRLARASGMSVAKGKYVYFCDQDDFVHPQLLEFCFRTCERNSLDFLAFYGHTFYSEDNPDVERVNVDDDSGLTVVSKGRESLMKDEARKALRSMQLDYWGQFARRGILRGIPFDYTRTFRIVLSANRWGWSRNAQTYWYYKSDLMTWSKLPVSAELIARNGDERIAVCDLFAPVRADGDPWGMWRIVQQHFLLKNMKMDLNALSKRNRKQPFAYRLAAKQAFANTIWEMYDRHCIDLRYIKVRHLMKYIWLMFRYGRYQRSSCPSVIEMPQPLAIDETRSTRMVE